MKQGAERRKTKRRPVLDTFSLFVVVPKKGMHRLQVHDLSEGGLGFDLDIDGENFDEFPAKVGEQIEVHLYLNQSLYLPLAAQIARVEDTKTVRRVGAEIVEKGSPSAKAFAAFLQMLDVVTEAGQIAQG
jgi:hypothetical protein